MATGARPESVNANLVLLSHAPRPVRALVEDHIDMLVDRVIYMRGPVPHVKAIDALAQLFQESAQVNGLAHAGAAAALVPYVFRHREVQVSALLPVAFPIVYAELAAGKNPPRILDFFPFYDWDRCKVAREELADAFANSVWPPSDLLLTAESAGILNDVLAYIARRYYGKKYLKLLRDAVSRVPEDLRAKIHRALPSDKDLDY
jgi:hypothetical protein